MPESELLKNEMIIIFEKFWSGEGAPGLHHLQVALFIEKNRNALKTVVARA